MGWIRWGIVFASLAMGTAAAAFSQKPVYIDPRLGGWAAPLETLCFQAGCGELYYVAGVWLGDTGELVVLAKSKVTFRRFDRRDLGAFAHRLARALRPAVTGLYESGRIDGVVLTFYCPQLRGNVLTLEVFESCLPARAFEDIGPVPVRVVERRSWALPPP
ncbi:MULTISPECIES: hypothetical protein [Deferrisoma]